MAMRNHKHRDVLRHALDVIMISREPTTILKTKAHAGHIGSEKAQLSDQASRHAPRGYASGHCAPSQQPTQLHSWILA